MPRSDFGLKRTADVVIIGGGVIGLSIARELAERELRDVLLIDRAELGHEASWAAGGILAPQVEADAANEFFKLACASRDLYPMFAAALKAETDVDIELDQTGTLYVAFSEREAQKLRRIFDWQVAEQLRVEWLSGDELRELEPNLSPLASCALRFPHDWQVENRKLVEALIRSNERAGVTLVADCAMTSIETKNDRVTGVQTSRGFLRTTQVIVAAGAWTSSIPIGETGTPAVEIEPVRGQMLCFKPEPQIARHVVYSSRGYLVPRRDGRLLAGSTSEHAGFDRTVTAEGMASIKSMACEIAPRLSSIDIVDSWAGFRPHAPDDLPILGTAVGVEGLFYATGHYRNGILLAPITAQIVADEVTGTRSLPLEAFSPNRFQLAPAAR